MLYLDPDTIINDSLSEFYHMDLAGAAIAAVRERCTGMDDIKRLGLKPDTVYINSGVLLMDLKKMREEMDIEELWHVLRAREEELLFPDQDLINIMWEGKIKYVKDGYNLHVNVLYLKEYLMPRAQKKSTCRIMHYIGPQKPWNSGYKGGCYSFWGRAEWHVNPSKRYLLAARLILGPWRFIRGLYLFVINHKWIK